MSQQKVNAEYRAGDVVLVMSEYTGHLEKLRLIGRTNWFQGNKIIGHYGFSAIGFDGLIWRGVSWRTIIRKVKPTENINCPHCTSRP